MGFVIQAGAGKAEACSRTGRTRAGRQRSQRPLGREGRGQGLRDAAWAR